MPGFFQIPTSLKNPTIKLFAQMLMIVMLFLISFASVGKTVMALTEPNPRWGVAVASGSIALVCFILFLSLSLRFLGPDGPRPGRRYTYPRSAPPGPPQVTRPPPPANDDEWDVPLPDQDSSPPGTAAAFLIIEQ